jgi:hypothetical protein
MKTWVRSLSLLFLFVIVLFGIFSADTWARREALTPEQKAKLERVERVLIEVLAITDKGEMPPGNLADIVAQRMKEFGYTVVTDLAQPHDVVFRVKCEQRKVWEGTTSMGSDADLPDSPSRVWKGPACQLLSLLDGKKMGWRKEVRTEFPDAQKAAAEAKVEDPGAYAMAKLGERLQAYDFPALIAAEWGQEDRLLKFLDDPTTTQERKVKIIGLLGYLFSTKSVPRLLEALKGPDVEMAKAAAVALGNIGRKETIPVLIEVLKTGKPELRAAAAKGLGLVGALHGDFTIIDPLLEALKTDDLTVKTEVAWALGKLPDRRAYDPLFAIQKSLFKVNDTTADPTVIKLKDAVNWSLKQIDTWEYLQ